MLNHVAIVLSDRILVFILTLTPLTLLEMEKNDIVAARPVEAPGIYVRIIPTAASLFSISKLNLNRNNVRAVNQGRILSVV